MINFYNQIPTIYSSASRDFQYLSWLINIVLNSVKHNVDDLYELPNNKADPRLAELLALTLGFKVRRNYNQDQLIALVSIIPSILRSKGTERALTLAGEALIRSSGSVGSFKASVNNNQIEIILPQGLIDVTLFIDLLPYIAPAGMTCKITRKTELSSPLSTELNYQEAVQAKWYNDVSINEAEYRNQTIQNQITGLSSLFNIDEAKVPVFTNYVDVYDDSDKLYHKELNAGLLSNTVIPVLGNAIFEQHTDHTNTNIVAEVEQITTSQIETYTTKEIEDQ